MLLVVLDRGTVDFENSVQTAQYCSRLNTLKVYFFPWLDEH